MGSKVTAKMQKNTKTQELPKKRKNITQIMKPETEIFAFCVIIQVNVITYLSHTHSLAHTVSAYDYSSTFKCRASHGV